ncbi:MAG TPA: redoxin domain-containing protein, partial [Candidatus Eisenbacteria bacterium]
VESGGRLLMRRRSEAESLMPGMWELPAWRTPDSGSIRGHVERDLGGGSVAIVPAGDARHAIMNRRLRLNVHHVEMARRQAPPGWHWIEPGRLGELPVSSMVFKALEAARGRLKLAFALLLAASVAMASGVPYAHGEDPAVTPAASAAVPADPDTTTIPLPIVPELVVRDIAGKEVSLHALLAKGPVLLNFWALWCKPCLKEIPELVKLQENYAARGFSLMLVNGDSPSDLARVAPFARARKMAGPVVTDVDGALRRRFQANAFPTSILLDRSGRTAWSAQGYRPGDEVKLAAEIEALLAK